MLDADGCKAQRAANGRSIGKRCNAADVAPGINPKGHCSVGALQRCGLLVENDYTAQPAPCTASLRIVALGMKPTEIGSKLISVAPERWFIHQGDLFTQLKNAVLPVALRVEPGKRHRKRRIIPAPRQPGGVMNQSQGA